LLAEIGLPHRVLPAQVDEWETGHGDPAGMVLHNARLKAEAIHAQHPQTLVLAADTTVARSGRVLAKPADMAEARQMLRTLSGQAHTVFTGVSLRGAEGYQVDEAVSSHVYFKHLSEEAITAYFERVNPLDKAGAYGIQEARELIIERWEGSLANVMGLPVEWLEETLRHDGLWEKLTTCAPDCRKR